MDYRKLNISKNVYSRKAKKKRNGNIPNRRWSANDHNTLLEFLKLSPYFEHPSPQIYYRRFLAEAKLPMDWISVRNKVRNMKVGYNKARALFNSNECIDLNTKIHKICPYYDDMDEIFGNRKIDFEQILFETKDHIYSDSNSVKTHTDDSQSSILDVQNGSSADDLEEIKEDENSHTEIIGSELRLDRDLFYENKPVQLKDTNKISAEDHELNRKQFNLKRLKELKYLKLKEQEIRRREKLRILELKMQERIALREMEIKERIVMRKLGNKQ